MAISLLPSVSTSALLRLELINWVHTMGSLHICEDMCIHIHKRFCCCSVAKSCLTLCDSMNWSKPGFPVFNYLLEFAQTHVHWVDNAIQPSHPLSSPSPPALNLSQDQGLLQCQLFASSGQSIGASASARVLPVNIQGWFPLDRLVWSPIHTHTQMSVQSERNIRILENSGHPILTCQPCSF